MTPRLETVLDILARHQVRFIVVGGIAAAAHGSSRATYDVDLVHSRDKTTIGALVRALSPFNPYPRGAPLGLPFHWDERTIEAGLIFTLTTTLGDLYLFGAIVGGGRYEELLGDTLELVVLGARCRFVTLPKLIELKRAACRPRDLEAIAELEALRDNSGRRDA